MAGPACNARVGRVMVLLLAEDGGNNTDCTKANPYHCNDSVGKKLPIPNCVVVGCVPAHNGKH